MFTPAIPLRQPAIARRPARNEVDWQLVHVNRTMRALREARLIETRRRHLKILDWERLKSAGEFDPAYLHLKAAV